MSNQHRSDASQQGALRAATLAQGYARLRCLSIRTRDSTGRNTLYLKAEGQVVHRHLSCDSAAPAFLDFSPCQDKQRPAYIFCRKSLLGHSSAVYGQYHTAASIVHQVSLKSMQPPLCLLIASGSLTFRQERAKTTRINRTPHYFSLYEHQMQQQFKDTRHRLGKFFLNFPCRHGSVT